MQIQKNDVITDGNGIVFKVLEVRDNELFIVNCTKKRMPFWIRKEELSEYHQYKLTSGTSVQNNWISLKKIWCRC
jgi:hypothetical protein